MSAYGNAATILPFPDLYASNRIAEPKVLSGGVSTGNWGKGGGLPGARTTGVKSDSVDYLKGVSLDVTPEGLQQEANTTREVLQAYNDLRDVYFGFKKKGINLFEVNPADPTQVEAAVIYKNLVADYQFKLNQVKQGAKYEELAAQTQAGNANVTPMPLDNTEVVTAADVAIATPATISKPVEMWNSEARTPPTSQAEYNTRIADYKRIMSGIDDQVRYAMIDGRTAAQWKANMLPPTPFVAEPIDPLADKFLDGAIANWNTETNQPPKSQTEYDTRLADYAGMVENVDRVGAMRGYNADQISAWKARLRPPTAFTPEAEDPLLEDKRAALRARTYSSNMSGALSAARIKDMAESGPGGSKNPVNHFLTSAGSFWDYAQKQIKADPAYLANVPVFDERDDKVISVEDFGKKGLAGELTHFGEPLNYKTNTGKEVVGLVLRKSKAGEPLLYIVERASIATPVSGDVINEPAYRFRRIQDTGNLVQKGQYKIPISLAKMSSGISSVSQVNASDIYGGGSGGDDFFEEEVTTQTPTSNTQAGSGVRKLRSDPNQ